jgi:hypothetical protein
MDDIIKEIEKLRREHAELLDIVIRLTKESRVGITAAKAIPIIEKASGKTWKEICEK